MKFRHVLCIFLLIPAQGFSFPLYDPRSLPIREEQALWIAALGFALILASRIHSGIQAIMQQDGKTPPLSIGFPDPEFHASHLDILESMEMGVIATDRFGRITYLNPEARMLTGWSLSDAQGESLSEVLRVCEEASRDPSCNPALLAIEDASPLPERNLIMIGKGGSESVITLSSTPIPGEDGQFAGSVTIFRKSSCDPSLVWQAGHDLLTGLLNRMLLNDRLIHSIESVKRKSKILAVIFLDLDGFKLVNDNFGHPIGDLLLKEVAIRLKKSVRAEDSVARLGGDEFVLLQEAADRNEIMACLERIMHAVNAPYFIDGTEVSVSPSMGVSVYPEDDTDPEILIKKADMAMYHAKQNGRNRFHFFEQSLNRQSGHDRKRRIVEAVSKNQLLLHYQPVIDLRSGEIAGFEALLRWQDPESGRIVLPRDFLPGIMDSDLIVDTGSWVLEHAIGQISAWHSMGLSAKVSINVAPRQLQDPYFPELLKSTLQRFPDVSPSGIELEILENAAISDFQQLQKTLLACREIGVRLSLDDFGTGYSSLSHLKNLPVDLIKIDQSFVNSMLEDRGSMEFVHGIVSMSKIFRKSVLAEGVESVMQGRTLRRMGCDLAQGYAISEPMPGEHIPQWVENWSEGWPEFLH